MMASKLSPRQQDVRDLVDQGYSAQQIADHLGTGVNNVYSHIRRMGEKGVHVSLSRQGGGSRKGSSNGRKRSSKPKRGRPAKAAKEETLVEKMERATSALGEIRSTSEEFIKAATERRGQIEDEIERLTEERDKLDSDISHVQQRLQLLREEEQGIEVEHASKVAGMSSWEGRTAGDEEPKEGEAASWLGSA